MDANLTGTVVCTAIAVCVAAVCGAKGFFAYRLKAMDLLNNDRQQQELAEIKDEIGLLRSELRQIRATATQDDMTVSNALHNLDRRVGNIELKRSGLQTSSQERRIV
jgi:hypothetical protein